MEKIYNKLVRDNIEEIMISKGAKPVTRILSEDEYLTELNARRLTSRRKEGGAGVVADMDNTFGDKK